MAAKSQKGSARRARFARLWQKHKANCARIRAEGGGPNEVIAAWDALPADAKHHFALWSNAKIQLIVPFATSPELIDAGSRARQLLKEAERLVREVERAEKDEHGIGIGFEQSPSRAEARAAFRKQVIAKVQLRWFAWRVASNRSPAEQLKSEWIAEALECIDRVQCVHPVSEMRNPALLKMCIDDLFALQPMLEAVFNAHDKGSGSIAARRARLERKLLAAGQAWCGPKVKGKPRWGPAAEFVVALGIEGEMPAQKTARTARMKALEKLLNVTWSRSPRRPFVESATAQFHNTARST